MGRCMYNLFPYVVVNMFLILLASADDIGRICPKTDDPDLCTRLLRSDPRSQSADLRELAQITINLQVTMPQLPKSRFSHSYCPRKILVFELVWARVMRTTGMPSISWMQQWTI